MRIKKGDTVVVISGKDKGKSGKILETYPKDNRVLVDGINMVSRHTKPKSAQEQGGIIKKSAPIDASNVMIFENGKATKVDYKFLDGKKVRVSHESGESLDKAFVKAVRKDAKANKASKEQSETKETNKVERAEKQLPVKEQKVRKVVNKKTPTVRKTVGNTGK